MDIYDYDIDIVNSQLTPPVLRQNKLLAWLRVLAVPIENLWHLIFNDYRLGNVYPDYDNSATYNFGDRVQYTDKCVYEAGYIDANGDPQSFNGVLPTNTLFWVKVNEIFIGSDERVKYSAQKILFEYALNKFFITTGIYIQNNFIDVGDVFVMDTLSTESSVMPLDSAYQEDYMDYTATFVVPLTPTTS